MTRRAAIWREHKGQKPWRVDVCDKRDRVPSDPIQLRCWGTPSTRAGQFPTHTEALAYALREVGLAATEGADQ